MIPLLSDADQKKLWRVVDGAVIDCMNQHPDYFTKFGKKRIRASLTKRVVGNLKSFAEQSAEGRTVTRSETAEPPRRVLPATRPHAWKRAAVLLVARTFFFWRSG